VRLSARLVLYRQGITLKRGIDYCMCRSIKVLRSQTPPATDAEISAAALQFVRKVSGFHKPSKVNQPPFDAAVSDISAVVERLLHQLDRNSRSSLSAGLQGSEPQVGL